jgi:hypothetical protein
MGILHEAIHSDNILLNSFNERCQTRVLEKIKTNLLCSITSFSGNFAIYENVERYGVARQASDIII